MTGHRPWSEIRMKGHDDLEQSLRIAHGVRDLCKMNVELEREIERRSPIPVTVDDEHAQPVSGWVMRLPEEMGGGWVLREWWSSHRRETDLDDVRTTAEGEQMNGRYWHEVDDDADLAGKHYSDARWWAEVYRVILASERAS